jgi:hypothetical protein
MDADADANMNCTKRRPEAAAQAGTVTSASVPDAAAKGRALTGMQGSARINYMPEWRWPDLAVQLFIHLGCLYGFYLLFTSVKILTALWGKSAILHSMHCQKLFLCHTRAKKRVKVKLSL